MFVMVVTFLVYVTGLAPASVAPDDVAGSWELSASEVRQERPTDHRWAWITSLGDATYLSFSALVLFPASTIALTVVAGVLYLRRRVSVYAVLAFCQAVVLIVAASGVVNRGV